MSTDSLARQLFGVGRKLFVMPCDAARFAFMGVACWDKEEFKPRLEKIIEKPDRDEFEALCVDMKKATGYKDYESSDNDSE